MIPLLLLLPLALGQNQPAGVLPPPANIRVVITTVPVEIDKAAQVARIDWTMPVSERSVYCIGSPGITDLRFTCPECNSTKFDQQLMSSRKDMSRILGFQAIMIESLRLNISINGKTLKCEGQYSDAVTQGSGVVDTNAIINIQFLDKPKIVNAKGEGPVQTPQGNRFYLQRGGADSMALRCEANGNPAPTSFSWTKDGVSLGQGQSFQAGQQLLDESISCMVSSPPVGDKESTAVKISPWDTPKLIGSNLDAQRIVRDNPGSFGADNKVEIGKTVKMNCMATGNPKPDIHWRMQSSGSERQVLNATCTSTQVILSVPGQTYAPNGQDLKLPNTVYVVSSECSVSVSNYSFAGNYWCSACNVVSESSFHCEPSSDRPATPNVAINVNGPPKRSNDPPSATQENKDALISTYYCADPPPEARNIFWTIGGERVNIGQTVGTYKAEPPQQNGTSCFTARLRISPVSEEDLTKPFVLSVANRYGTERIPVDVRGLLASEEQLAEVADVGLIVGLTLGILLFLCLVIPACMWWRGLGCFSGPRKSPPEKYASNIAPEHVRSEPIPPSNGNGYNPQNDSSGSSFSPYGGVYNKGPVGPAERETLSYAAMDLVAEPPAGGRQPPPPDYSHLAPRFPTPTNSVV